MGAPLVVATYGRSLILESVGRRLEQSYGISVTTVDDPGGLATLEADVLMVDLAVLDVPEVMSLLVDRPDLMVVGLEGGGARLLLLGGSRARAFSTDDLLAVIRGRRGAVASN